MNNKTTTGSKNTKQPGTKTTKQGNLQETINKGNQKLSGAASLDRINNNDSSTDDERQRRSR